MDLPDNLTAARLDAHLDALYGDDALPFWGLDQWGVYRTAPNGARQTPQNPRNDVLTVFCDMDDDIVVLIEARPQRGTNAYAHWRAGMRRTMAARLDVKRALWARWRAREAAVIGTAA